MNRRNFVVGLGTVATISGVASVTAASFANEFEATSDFRVVVDEELIFERGDNFEDTDEFDADLEAGINGDDSEFEDAVSDEDPIAVFVNDDQNDEVETALAVLNDEDVGEETLEGIYKITNDGSVDQDVNILFDFGEDVGDSGAEVDEQTVVELFAFEDTDNNQISPDSIDDGEQEQPPEELTIEPGDEEEINLVINLDETAEDLAEAAGVDPFEADEEETLDLVDALEVGTDLDIDDSD